jgi:lysophospholipase L1-like esterase
VSGEHWAEAADPYCLRAGEAAGLLRGHPWRRFAVLGDSVAEGIGEPMAGYHPLQFCDRVYAELAAAAPEVAYLNLGRRNLRAADVRREQLGPALAFRPDLAMVVCGANDAMQPGYERRADAVDADIRAMATALLAAGADVITVSLLVMPDYPAVPAWLGPAFVRRMVELGHRTSRLAAAAGTLHVELADHPALAEGPLTGSDGLHGDGRSQAISAAATVRRLGAHLASARTP